MSHTLLIDRWATLSDFAADIGVPYGTAKQMRRRGNIPAEYWRSVVDSAKRRGITHVSLDVLAELAAARRHRAEAAADEAAA